VLGDVTRNTKSGYRSLKGLCNEGTVFLLQKAKTTVSKVRVSCNYPTASGGVLRDERIVVALNSSGNKGGRRR
jgi:hypothetical protein